MLRSIITGTGAYLPERVVHNNDLPASLETNHEWIVERTGIVERHIAAEGQFTSDLATRAARDALQNAGVDANSIELIIVATTSPDETLPSTATKVQQQLGITSGAAFDIGAACSGFVYALSVADSFIRTGTFKRILVIGAETYSRIVDWTDRTTCILFGDGAGAVVIEAGEGTGSTADRGILSAIMNSDGRYLDILKSTGGPSSTQTVGTLYMSGKEVFKHAAFKMPSATEASLQAVGLTTADIDWLVPHQANVRILQAVGQKLGVEESRVISTVAGHANTSAASIPLALHTGVMDGRIKQGQLLACPALGAGLTWGCALIRW
jgi:3-oxoacyl-[acyl-carrier-protein] synthase III